MSGGSRPQGKSEKNDYFCRMDSSLRYTARDLTAELPAAEYIARFRDAGRIGGY